MGKRRRERQSEIVKADKGKEARAVAYYSAVVEAWINTRMERDKSILTLSTAGLGLLVTLITTVGARNLVEAVFYLLAFISFGVSSWTAVAIFGRNADYLERLAKGEDCTDPELAKLDRLLRRGFFIGVLAAALLGITSYISRRTEGDGEMAGKKEQAQQDGPLQKKSLNQLNKLKPDSGAPKTGSVDGLNRLKTVPSTTPAKDQTGGKSSK